VLERGVLVDANRPWRDQPEEFGNWELDLSPISVVGDSRIGDGLVDYRHASGARAKLLCPGARPPALPARAQPLRPLRKDRHMLRGDDQLGRYCSLDTLFVNNL
jgi:hypothetical protein